MTEGLNSEALFLKIYFFEKIPPACLTATHLPLQGRQNPSGLPKYGAALFVRRLRHGNWKLHHIPPTKSDDYNSKFR